MKSANQAEIRKAFTQQAGGFESERMNFSKKDYLMDAVSKIAPYRDGTAIKFDHRWVLIIGRK